MKTISRRAFVGSIAMAAAPGGRDACANENPLVLGVPLTHSDWMLKPGIAWGAAGVRHMLDACKACGWSQVYWRALDGGRSLYTSKLLKPMGPWGASTRGPMGGCRRRRRRLNRTYRSRGA